jgi:hypothetical protein
MFLETYLDFPYIRDDKRLLAIKKIHGDYNNNKKCINVGNNYKKVFLIAVINP